VDSGVRQGDPHQLILMLYDGVLAAIHEARGHLAAKRVAAKGAAIGKAVRIVDEGLKASLDTRAGGQLAFRLLDLYDYAVMRLLQANLRNDETALTEIAGLLGNLREAWSQIRPGAVPQSATNSAANPAAAAAAITPQAPAGARRLTVSA
jgi:flagellar protein FliS